MEIRKLSGVMFGAACAVCTFVIAVPASAVGLKVPVVHAATTSKANAAKPVNKVDGATPTSETTYEMAKSAWGAPAQVNYYGLPTSDAQRKFK